MMKPVSYYTAASTRELDRLAIEEHGIPGFVLMQRAGRAAYKTLVQKWPKAEKLLIICGTGNNGGDGFIIADLAIDAGLQVELYLLGEFDRLKGDALLAADFALAHDLNIQPGPGFQDSEKLKNAYHNDTTVIVDAMLGTGLSGNVREPYTRLIKQINNCGLPVLAVDIPSGLCSDTGTVLGNAVMADVTVTFIGRKIGQVLANGPDYCGELVFDDLDVPATVYAKVPASSVANTPLMNTTDKD